MASSTTDRGAIERSQAIQSILKQYSRLVPCNLSPELHKGIALSVLTNHRGDEAFNSPADRWPAQSKGARAEVTFLARLRISLVRIVVEGDIHDFTAPCTRLNYTHHEGLFSLATYWDYIHQTMDYEYLIGTLREMKDLGYDEDACLFLWRLPFTDLGSLTHILRLMERQGVTQAELTVRRPPFKTTAQQHPFTHFGSASRGLATVPEADEAEVVGAEGETVSDLTESGTSSQGSKKKKKKGKSKKKKNKGKGMAPVQNEPTQEGPVQEEPVQVASTKNEGIVEVVFPNPPPPTPSEDALTEGIKVTLTGDGKYFSASVIANDGDFARREEEERSKRIPELIVLGTLPQHET